MLSTQAVRGLPRLRAPGVVPCIISFSRLLPCFLDDDELALNRPPDRLTHLVQSPCALSLSLPTCSAVCLRLHPRHAANLL